jgi:hypothetical protein
MSPAKLLLIELNAIPPEGLLIVYRPTGRHAAQNSRPRISTIDVAPSILANFGFDPLAHMERSTSMLQPH